MRSRQLCLPLLMIASSVISGCAEVTIGPRVETHYVIVKPGQPIRILENKTVRGERLDGAGVADIDIGGWVAMPPEHWEVINKMLVKDH